MNKVLEQKLATLPKQPGIYQFFDVNKNLIYVGKAKNLRNRVRSYFHADAKVQSRTAHLVKKIVDLETIIVENEVEALLLESNLIKQHQPRYNILLKDDKNYLYVKVTLSEDFPGLELTRRMAKNTRDRYFGPYTSANKIKKTVKLLNKLFGLRACNSHFAELAPGKIKVLKKDRPFPCLYYHLKQCPGMCIGEISQADYQPSVQATIRFLNGDIKPALQNTQSEMQKAAQAKNFEYAARLRDRYAIIQDISEKQHMISGKSNDEDLINLAIINENIAINLFQIRAGKLIGREMFELRQDPKNPESNAEILSAFLTRYYLETSNLPREIVLPTPIADEKEITTLINQLSPHKIKLIYPKIGDRQKLLKLAAENAQLQLEQNQASFEKAKLAPTELVKVLKKYFPKISVDRMECYDISHTGGTNTVASMVVFEKGLSNPKEYRLFNLTSLASGEIDDFKAMHEVLERRLKYLSKEKSDPQKKKKFQKLPNLIVIDGGIGQLGVAQKVLSDLKLAIPVIGLAKKNEEIWIDKKTSLTLDRHSPALQLLQKIRDESHRFAITHQKKLRGKQMIKSVLDDIPGLGPKKKKELLDHFGTVSQIRSASDTELSKIIGSKLIQKLRESI